MDANRPHNRRENWVGRRISQDLTNLQSTLTARSTRPTNSSRENLKTGASDEADQCMGDRELNRPYQVFLKELEQKLIDSKDSKQRPLWTSDQVQAQLQVQPQLLHDRCFGELGGVTYFARGDNGTDRLHSYVPVNNIINSVVGLRNCEQKWKAVFGESAIDFSWVHIPANNMEWARGAIRQIVAHFICNDRGLQDGSIVEDKIFGSDLWDDQQNHGLAEIPHARFMRPFCRSVEVSVQPTVSASQLRQSLTRPTLDPSIQSILASSFVLFMPFLHWETTLAYENMQMIIQDVNAGGVGVFSGFEISKLPCGVDEKLLRQYLQHLQPVHVRRTLDQFGYYTLADTSSRDKDQVIDRYAREHETTDLVVTPLLMVDQLWLWVIGDTVLTCFPHRWNKNLNHTDDVTDVYQDLLESFDDPIHRITITSAEQLAESIIDRCARNVLDRSLIRDEHLRFMDFFEWSIDDLHERQSQCLQKLWNDVQSSTDDQHDDLINISQEFFILERAKDIMDELQIINRLIDQQSTVFTMRLNEEDDIQIDTPADEPELYSSQLPYRYESIDFKRLREKATERAEGIRVMIDRANVIYDAVLDILSLKQQQANILEARSSRKAAQEMEKLAKEAKKAGEEAEKQGYSIMLFTIVTIFFLPVSAVAGFFGVNAVEFGQGTMSLGTICAWVFPISIAVVYISFMLAFNHKARRTVVLCLHILRAYLNLLYPIVFDEHKESKLQLKLDELKQRRRAQRQRKLEKQLAKQAKKSSSMSTETRTENIQNEPNISSPTRVGEATSPRSSEDSSRAPSVRQPDSFRFSWAGFKTRSKEADYEAGHPDSIDVGARLQDSKDCYPSSQHTQ